MKIKLFQQLSSDQWGWVWIAYWRLWPVLLRIKLKQRRWLRAQLSLGRSTPEEFDIRPDDAEAFDAMYESVRLAARLHILSAACLPRSIVFANMLKSRGHNAQVCLGVGKEGQNLASHAWVEVDGHIVAEPESVAQTFSRIES